jgi:hypothetical protein
VAGMFGVQYNATPYVGTPHKLQVFVSLLNSFCAWQPHLKLRIYKIFLLLFVTLSIYCVVLSWHRMVVNCHKSQQASIENNSSFLLLGDTECHVGENIGWECDILIEAHMTKEQKMCPTPIIINLVYYYISKNYYYYYYYWR